MSSLERLLSVLDVFSEEKPVWTIEDIAEAQGYPKSTVYRYVKELRDSRLLISVGRSGYILGPRIIELDRQIQACDPLLTAGKPLIADMASAAGEGVVLLCSLYGDAVLCVYSHATTENMNVSYTRGRPMPLFRGSASKVILAHLPNHRLTKIFLNFRPLISEAGLGNEWNEFKQNLQAIRQQPFYATSSEIDKGVLGISAPIFSASGVLASLTFATPHKRQPEKTIGRIADLIIDHAERIGADVAALMRNPPQRRQSGNSQALAMRRTASKNKIST